MSSSSTTPLAQSASTPTSVTDHVAPKSFPLLDLPDELILQILKHAVVTSSEDIVIPVLKGRRLDPPEPELHLAQPAITRVSRAFRCEGLKLFYGQNTFLSYSHISGLNNVYDWVRSLGRERAAGICNIFVIWQTPGPTWTFAEHELRYIRECQMSWGGVHPKTFVRECRGPQGIAGYQMSFGKPAKTTDDEGGAKWLELNPEGVHL